MTTKYRDEKQQHFLKKLTDIISDIPFNRILGLRMDAVQKDHIALRFEMKDELVGNFLQGILHGGVISSVLDMAGGAAAMIAAADKYPEKNLEELAGVLGKSSTINLHIDYI